MDSMEKCFFGPRIIEKAFFGSLIIEKAFFWTSDPWSMVHGPFWRSFSRKNRPEYCFLQYVGALREFIPGSRGSSGSRGNGVRNRRSDPPFHGQEFSDDGSSQQTPSNKKMCDPLAVGRRRGKTKANHSTNNHNN